MMNEQQKKNLEWGKFILLAIITVCLLYISFHLPQLIEIFSGIERGLYNN